MKIFKAALPYALFIVALYMGAAIGQFAGYPPLGYVQIGNDGGGAPTWQPNPALLQSNNLSDLSSAEAARANLGLGSMALQNSDTVGISGGAITGMPTPVAASDVATKAYVDSQISTGFGGLPLLTSVVPSSGGSGGGTSVTINGVHFTGLTGVNFGANPATPITFVTDNAVTATSPAGTGTVDIRVVTASGTSPVVPADHFNYAGPAPTVSSISPRSGPTGGGTSVGIVGTHLTGATSVHFGTATATTFSVNNDSSITSTAPAHAAGTVDVTATTPNGTSATGAPDQYIYTSSMATSTGGTITVAGGFRIHTFRGSGTFTPSGTGTVTYIVVAGGAGGANSLANAGAGGGGGGGQVVVGNFSGGIPRTITVGQGGGTQSVGGASSISGIAAATAGDPGGIHLGGGSGSGQAGGGGGAQGAGGGGGDHDPGANGSGPSGGNGGNGTLAALCNNSSVFGGGGGGGAGAGGTLGAGGLGGGGAGSQSGTAFAGAANTGGGGGGGGSNGSGGGAGGGTGIAILCYPYP